MSASDATIRDMLRRINELERNQVNIRQGQVSGGAVDLGSSGSSHTIPSLSSGLQDGDLVSVAVQGKKQVTLGKVGGVDYAVPGDIPAWVGQFDQDDFLKLAAAGDIKVAFGSGSVTGDGDAVASTSVSHGLGKTPSVVVANSTHSSNDMVCRTSSYGSTTFALTMTSVSNSAWSESRGFVWIAIG